MNANFGFLYPSHFGPLLYELQKRKEIERGARRNTQPGIDVIVLLMAGTVLSSVKEQSGQGTKIVSIFHRGGSGAQPATRVCTVAVLLRLMMETSFFRIKID